MAMVECPTREHPNYDDTMHSGCPFCRNVKYPYPSAVPPTEFHAGGRQGNRIPPTEGTAPMVGGGQGNFQSVSPTVPYDRAVDSGASGATRAVGVDGASFNPVVGWFVVLSENARGKDFRIRSGWNVIGRLPECAIYLDFEEAVTRGKHAHVVFDNESNEYFIKHTDGANGTRLNGKMVGDLTKLNAGDIVRIGATELMFVPLCGKDFTWTPTKAAPAGDGNVPS